MNLTSYDPRQDPPAKTLASKDLECTGEVQRVELPVRRLLHISADTYAYLRDPITDTDVKRGGKGAYVVRFVPPRAAR